MFKMIPNLLTILRVIAIPFFVFFIIKNQPLYGLVIFILASITDYFDGLIARKFNIISTFGKLMDPLADKILVISALVLLNIEPIAYIHWIVTFIICFREIAVTVLREYYHKKEIIIAANFAGKIKTFLQMFGIITALLIYTMKEFGFWDFVINNEQMIIFYIQVYFWATTFVTVLSGLNYFFIKPKRIIV
ncbi:MAG: CDP-diacylglycerol--glycerol-3-phosphate 3-phosphatidyltransferase [Candidatus Cloacimonetes bacterium]|nr:CDP-diacylglycerol--glycerol-3-phosphate 3-phosphatidyltransferase [Candidatus Cloacimonadota bacterium]MDD4156649.1 CDP-diacylglycerol--glycerol-3-phosphate 3-phosphatidyltransferase [Candidatus Cloacimonadota bacterium]